MRVRPWAISLPMRRLVFSLPRYLATQVAFLALFAVPAAAQVGHFRMGVAGGVNASRLTTRDDRGTGGTTGVTAGAQFAWMPVPYFGVDLDVLYSTKGSAQGGVFVDVVNTPQGQAFQETQTTLKTRISYLELPLLAEGRIPLSPRGSPALYAVAGPVLSFRLSCELAREDVTVVTAPTGQELSRGSQKASIPCGDEIESTDIGLAIGGGLDFAVIGQHLGISARYTIGLRSIGENFNSKNRVLWAYLRWFWSP